LAQMNHSELSHMAGAVDDSTINIVEVIIIIIIIMHRLSHLRRTRLETSALRKYFLMTIGYSLRLHSTL